MKFRKEQVREQIFTLNLDFENQFIHPRKLWFLSSSSPPAATPEPPGRRALPPGQSKPGRGKKEEIKKTAKVKLGFRF